MPLGAGSSARIATNYGAVTPSNTVDFPDEVAGLWIGGAGNISIVKRDGTAVLFSGVQAGTYMPLSCIRVNSTNTTATLICWLT